MFYLLHNGFFSIKTFLWTSCQLASWWSTKLSGNFFAFSFWRIFLDLLFIRWAYLLWPFCTFLFGCVSLCHILAFFFLNGFTFNFIFFNVVFVVSGLTLRLINRFALNWSFAFANQRRVTKLYLFLSSNLFIFNKAILDIIFFALFFLLRLKSLVWTRVTHYFRNE